MLKRLLRNIGLEVLDEIGDEITDLFFGDLKNFIGAVGIILFVLFGAMLFYGYLEIFG